MLQEGSERNVLEAAAWDGFAKCPGPYLDKLLKLRELLKDLPKDDRPKSVLAKVDMLVTHILPGISDAEKAQIMRRSCLLYTSPSPRDVEESGVAGCG